MENKIETNNNNLFQGRLDDDRKRFVEKYLEGHPELTKTNLLKLMVDKLAIDETGENDSALSKIKGYWLKIERIVSGLETDKDDAILQASSKVEEELEELKATKKSLTEERNRYKEENDKFKLQLAQVEDLKKQIVDLQNDKKDLTEKNTMLSQKVIDSATSMELQLENEKLRTEIANLRGELKYQTGYADGLKEKNEVKEDETNKDVPSEAHKI